uniref:Uncharacterized protein n=1 Tax=Hyaloperonospora arabidopsidis (strain Emoy2) TaxID=559515 RepID=M4BC50_HYAAE
MLSASQLPQLGSLLTNASGTLPSTTCTVDSFRVNGSVLMKKPPMMQMVLILQMSLTI